MNRVKGYYWVRIKRTKIWIIAKWIPSLNQGKGHWDTMTLENDPRGGFDKVDETPLIHKEEAPERIKRVRLR